VYEFARYPAGVQSNSLVTKPTRMRDGVYLAEGQSGYDGCKTDNQFSVEEPHLAGERYGDKMMQKGVSSEL
jgi:hypothetical protein